jgi:hypothetical protein
MVPTTQLDQAIRQLQESYRAYMASLKEVLDLGEDSIEALTRALNHKHANPIAKALGCMMQSPAAERAIPRLLDWLVVQSPLYPDVLAALVRAGAKALPFVVRRIKEVVAQGDDEAVRNLLDLGCHFSGAALHSIVEVISDLLRDGNPHVREAAAEACARIGLPQARLCEARLKELAVADPEGFVRAAATQALERLGKAV